MKKNYCQSLIIIFLFIVFFLLGTNFNVLNQNQNLEKHKTNHITNSWEPKTDFWKETGRFPYLDKVYTKKTDLGNTSPEHWVDMGHYKSPASDVPATTIKTDDYYNDVYIYSFEKNNWKGVEYLWAEAFVNLSNFIKTYGEKRFFGDYFIVDEEWNPYDIKDVQIFADTSDSNNYKLVGVRFLGVVALPYIKYEFNSANQILVTNYDKYRFIFKIKNVYEKQPSQGFVIVPSTITNNFFKYFGNINSVGLYTAQQSLTDVIIESLFWVTVFKITFITPPKEEDKTGKTTFINLKEFNIGIKRNKMSIRNYDKLNGDLIPDLNDRNLYMKENVQKKLEQFINEGQFKLKSNGKYYAVFSNNIKIKWKVTFDDYNNSTYTLTDFRLTYSPNEEFEIEPQKTKLNLLTAVTVTDLKNDGSVDLNFAYDKMTGNTLPEDNNLNLQSTMKSQLEAILSNALDEKNKTIYQSFSTVTLNWNKTELKNKKDGTTISLLNELTNFNWEKQQFEAFAKKINYIHAEWQPEDKKGGQGWGIHEDRYRIFFKVGEVENPNSEFPLGTEKIFFVYDKSIDFWENMFNLQKLPNQIQSYRQEVKDANFTWEQNNKSLGKDKNLERVAYNISGSKISYPEPPKPQPPHKDPNQPNQPAEKTFWEEYGFLFLIIGIIGIGGGVFFFYKKRSKISLKIKSNKRKNN